MWAVVQLLLCGVVVVLCRALAQTPQLKTAKHFKQRKLEELTAMRLGEFGQLPVPTVGSVTRATLYLATPNKTFCKFSCRWYEHNTRSSRIEQFENKAQR